MSYEANPEFQKAVLDLIREYSIASDKLTREQLAKCILQALECGDFIKQVAVSTGQPLGQVGPQAVFYAPFAESERLKARIKQLKDTLDEEGVPIPKEPWLA